MIHPPPVTRRDASPLRPSFEALPLLRARTPLYGAWLALGLDGTRVSSAYSADLRFSKSLQEGTLALLECLLLTVPDPDEA